MRLVHVCRESLELVSRNRLPIITSIDFIKVKVDILEFPHLKMTYGHVHDRKYVDYDV